MRWFEDPAEGERLGDPLAQLAVAVSRMLDGLPPTGLRPARAGRRRGLRRAPAPPPRPRVPPGDPAGRVVLERRLLPGRLSGPPRPGGIRAALAAHPPGPGRPGLGIDSAVGLWWLARYEPATPDEAARLWPAVLLSAGRVAATGLAVVLVFVLADRRRAMTWPAAGAGLAGAILLALAWSLTLQLGIGWLVPLLPQALGSVVLSAPVLLAGFAGTALVAVAAAAQAPSRVEGSPSANVATASPRNPRARPSWGE